MRWQWTFEYSGYVTRFCESNAEGVALITGYQLTDPAIPWIWDWFLLQGPLQFLLQGMLTD